MSKPGDWKEEYENAATADANRLSRLDVGQLLDKIAKRDFGPYFSLWYVLAEKATLAQAGWPLYEMLVSKEDYLHRYHAAAALIKLLGSPLQPVDLSAVRPTLASNLETIRDALTTKLAGTVSQRPSGSMNK